MSNSLDDVTPQLLAQGMLAFRENAIMPQLVNRAYDQLAGEKGSTIDVPIPSAITTNDVTPGPTPPTDTGVAPSKVPIALNYWREAPFYLTDKDLLTAMDGTIPMQASAAIKALANYVDSTIISLYKKFYTQFSLGTGAFLDASGVSTITHATKVRALLNKALAPMDDRRMVLDPDAEANALGNRAFHDMSFSGSAAAIIEGRLETKFGFGWFMDQNVPTHTRGTAASATVTLVSNSTLGASSVTLKVSASTATVKIGDIFTIAGDSQQYVVTADATLDTTGVAVSISPALKVAVNGSVTPVAVTYAAGGVMNLAFHRDAIAFATRPLQNVPDGLGARTQVLVDEVSGLALRLEVTRQHKQTRYSYDVLFGCDVVLPAFGVRVQG